MKGKYNGRHMTVYGSMLPGAASIARGAFLADNLTERAEYRLRVLDWHRAHGGNASLTARHFGLGRMTLYRWLKRFKQCGMAGLNEHSRRPKNVRRPVTPWQAVDRTIQLRKQHPAWSEYKLKVLLEREGIEVSASTAGRILKRKGLINQKAS